LQEVARTNRRIRDQASESPLPQEVTNARNDHR
jgi:hypothetical protein